MENEIAVLLVFKPEVDKARIDAWIEALKAKDVLRAVDLKVCGEHDHPTLYFP